MLHPLYSIQIHKLCTDLIGLLGALLRRRQGSTWLRALLLNEARRVDAPRSHVVVLRHSGWDETHVRRRFLSRINDVLPALLGSGRGCVGRIVLCEELLGR